jgi:hypothetical protein
MQPTKSFSVLGTTIEDTLLQEESFAHSEREELKRKQAAGYHRHRD